MKKILIAVIVIASLFSCGTVKQAEHESGVLTVLYFQDGHEPQPVLQKDGERGGWGRVATVLQAQRRSNPHTITIFGGDLAGGTLFGGMYKGQPVVEAFNALGVEYANFGNHAFDFGLENLKQLQQASRFTWINSNLETKDGTPFTTPQTALIRKGALSIGILGLTGEMEKTTVMDTLRQIPTDEAITSALDSLQTADVIIAVTQLSKEENRNFMQKFPQITLALCEEYTLESDTDIITLDNGRIIASPKGNMGSIIKADISIGENGKIICKAAALPVDASVPPDRQLQALADSYTAKINTLLSEKVASADAVLDRTQAGLLIAEAFRSAAQSDIAWCNPGGARSTLPAAHQQNEPFAITRKDAYTCLPFGNRLAVFKVNGAQLKQALEEARELPLPAGFTYTYSEVQDAARKRSVTHISIGGEPLDVRKVYTLCITSYVASPIKALSDAKQLHTSAAGMLDAEALIRYLQHIKTVRLPLVHDVKRAQ